MANIKYDWNKLRREFILGNIDTVTNFFKAKGLAITGSIRKKTAGWTKQRDAIKTKQEEQVQGEVTKSLVESEAQVRSRLARLSRTLQYKGIKAINNPDIKVENVESARRLITDGIKTEIESLDLNKQPLFTGNVNIAVLQTRYGQMLQGLTYEELIEVITGLKQLNEQRASGLPTSINIGSGDKTSQSP